jgi:hypothetical protein
MGMKKFKLILPLFVSLLLGSAMADSEVYPGYKPGTEIDLQKRTFVEYYYLLMKNYHSYQNKAELFKEELVHLLEEQSNDKGVNARNFKCQDGIEKLPGHQGNASATNTELKIRFVCLNLNRYQEVAANTHSNTVDTAKVIKDYFDSVPENPEYIEDEKLKVATSKEVCKEGRYCDSAELFPSDGNKVIGLDCTEVFKAEGEEWQKAWWDFKCINGKVTFLSKKYRVVANKPCAAYSTKTTAPGPKKESEIWYEPIYFSSTDDFGGYGVASCVGNRRIDIADIPFKPLKCKDIGKQPGDVWWKTGGIEEVKCDTTYCQKENAAKPIKERYIEYAWHCANNGVVMPFQEASKHAETLGTRGIQTRYQRFGGRNYIQNKRTGTFKGEGCFSISGAAGGTKQFTSTHCTREEMSPPTCSGEYPIQVSNEEAWKGDDMMTGVDSSRCFNFEYTVPSGNSNQCGGPGTKYYQCVTQCRKACEEVKDVLLDYYNKTGRGKVPPATTPDENKYYPDLEGVEDFIVVKIEKPSEPKTDGQSSQTPTSAKQ